MNPFIRFPGSDPARAVAAKIQAELKAKKAARAYEEYVKNSGMNRFDAQRLAPPLVKKGQTLRSIEAKQRVRNALQAKRERLARRFG